MFPFPLPYLEIVFGFRGKSRVGCQSLGGGMGYLGYESSFHFSRRVGKVEKVLGRGAISLVPNECFSGSVIVLGR